MKAKTLYTCEYCHTDYKDETEALACEQNHIFKLNIHNRIYKPKGIETSGFPVRLEMQAPDGRICLYEKVRIL